MEAKDQIIAKVAQIITPTSLAINAGSNEGVTAGDSVTLFRIVEVADPETREPLGSVRVPRLHLEVTFAQEKFSVAQVTDRASNSFYSIALGPDNLKKISTEPQYGPSAEDVVTVQIGEDAIVNFSSERRK